VLTANDKFSFSTAGMQPTGPDANLASAEIAKIQVFPNPYFASNLAETNQFARFVTFSHLPATATIRIFSLAGDLVKTIRHDESAGSAKTFERWDLRNEYNLPAASGMYIALIETQYGSRTLKLAIIQPEERVNKL
jgi:hypothetical protein